MQTPGHVRRAHRDRSYYSSYRGLVSIYRASDGVLLKQFRSGSNDYLLLGGNDGDTVVGRNLGMAE